MRLEVDDEDKKKAVWGGDLTEQRLYGRIWVVTATVLQLPACFFRSAVVPVWPHTTQ